MVGQRWEGPRLGVPRHRGAVQGQSGEVGGADHTSGWTHPLGLGCKGWADGGQHLEGQEALSWPLALRLCLLSQQG